MKRFHSQRKLVVISTDDEENEDGVGAEDEEDEEDGDTFESEEDTNETLTEAFERKLKLIKEGVLQVDDAIDFLIVDEKGNVSNHSCYRYSTGDWECASVYDFLNRPDFEDLVTYFKVHDDECVRKWEYDPQDHIGRDSDEDVAFFTITVPVLKTFFAAHADRRYLDGGDEFPGHIRFICNINTNYLGM